MKNWMRRIRGAIGMGLTWAAGWAFFGVLLGVTSRLLPGLPWDSFFEVFDAPLPALAVPGFFGGVIFSIVLGIVAHDRKFNELSIPRFAVWGAVGGLLLSLLPAAMVGVGLASLGREGLGLWELTAVIAPPLIALSALSASGSLALARMTEGKVSAGKAEDIALSQTASRELAEGSELSSRDLTHAARQSPNTRP
jgi:hypothetical protein